MHDLTRAGSAIAEHPAAKVLGAEALHPTSKASYFDILTVRIFRAVFLLHEFREVVAVGARRLTDKQKKKIVADYVQLQSYRAAAKLNDVSDATVKKVVKEDPESARLCAQKKRENSKDMLSYMESKQEEAQELLGLYLKAMADPDKIAEATLPLLSTAFGTIVDKFAMLGDQSNIDAPDDGLLEALSAAADLSLPDDVEMLPEEEDDNAEK